MSSVLPTTKTTRWVSCSGELKTPLCLAIDVISLAHQQNDDVALVFSQDQDLSEVADEIRKIAVQQGRWIKMASAFPFSPASPNRRGINGADWIKIDRATYDACLDTRDYRPKGKAK